MIEEARKKFERIARGESTLVDEFKDRSIEYVLSLAIFVLFWKPAREPKIYYIRKGEHSGEYYESKPFYSSVLTEEEVKEIEGE